MPIYGVECFTSPPMPASARLAVNYGINTRLGGPLGASAALLAGSSIAAVPTAPSGPSFSYIGDHASDLSASPQSSHTYTAASIGIASADRIVFIVLAASSNNSLAGEAPTCSVQGTSMTVGIGSENTGANAFDLAYIWYGNIPSGTNGDIVITLTTAQLYTLALSVYTATGLNSSTPVSTGADHANPGSGVDHISTSITVNSGGLGFVACDVDAAVAISTSGFTFDQDLSQAVSHQTIGRVTASGTVTVQWALGNNLPCAIAAASWR